MITGESHNKEQDQLQEEQHGLLEHLRHRPVIESETRSQTIKQSIIKFDQMQELTTAFIQRPNTNSKKILKNGFKSKSSEMETIVATNMNFILQFLLKTTKHLLPQFQLRFYPRSYDTTTKCQTVICLSLRDRYNRKMPKHIIC